MPSVIAPARPFRYTYGPMKAPLKPAVLLALFVVAALGGCGSDRLETGYAYTPLGDSTAKRRGYYADPFSPEARAAQTEVQNQTDMGGRRAVPGN